MTDCCVPPDVPIEHCQHPECPPTAPDPCACEQPVCGKPNLRYIQPPPAKSCKPVVCFERPCIPVESGTIYKNSYMGIDPQLAASCRLPPNKPKQCIDRADHVKMEKESVTTLSYPGHFCIPRQNPIKPNPRSLLGEGPMQALTTQKHDYVPKPYCKRNLVIPPTLTTRASAPLERETVQRLSFPRPNLVNYSPALSCKPHAEYKKPDIPMENETVQKLSYLPVNLPAKECYPWARRPKYQMPIHAMDMGTVQRLSYTPPGRFIDGAEGCLCDLAPNCQFVPDCYPKAAVY